MVHFPYLLIPINIQCNFSHLRTKLWLLPISLQYCKLLGISNFFPLSLASTLIELLTSPLLQNCACKSLMPPTLKWTVQSSSLTPQEHLMSIIPTSSKSFLSQSPLSWSFPFTFLLPPGFLWWFSSLTYRGSAQTSVTTLPWFWFHNCITCTSPKHLHESQKYMPGPEQTPEFQTALIPPFGYFTGISNWAWRKLSLIFPQSCSTPKFILVNSTPAF